MYLFLDGISGEFNPLGLVPGVIVGCVVVITAVGAVRGVVEWWRKRGEPRDWWARMESGESVGSSPDVGGGEFFLFIPFGFSPFSYFPYDI